MNNKAEITVIILTYNRIEGLKRVVNSVIKNTNDIAYELLVIIDNNDLASYNYCIENNIKCFLSSFHRDFVAQANMAMYACETKYFVKLDDDMAVLSPDWLSFGLRIYKEKFPDNLGLLLFNDGIQNGKVFTTGISSKDFIHWFGGYMYYPEYKHYGGDREVTNIAKGIGCYYYEKDIHINHYHPSQKTADRDSTYKLSEDKFWKQDQKLKKQRRDGINLPAERNFYLY